MNVQQFGFNESDIVFESILAYSPSQGRVSVIEERRGKVGEDERENEDLNKCMAIN